jgi:hypothetical protein
MSRLKIPFVSIGLALSAGFISLTAMNNFSAGLASLI